MHSLDVVWAAIRQEMAYQDRKYGPPAVRGETLKQYARIADAEFNEVWSALSAEDYAEARCELLQVAAVIVQALLRHGVITREALAARDEAAALRESGALIDVSGWTGVKRE